MNWYIGIVKCFPMAIICVLIKSTIPKGIIVNIENFIYFPFNHFFSLVTDMQPLLQFILEIYYIILFYIILYYIMHFGGMKKREVARQEIIQENIELNKSKYCTK